MQKKERKKKCIIDVNNKTVRLWYLCFFMWWMLDGMTLSLKYFWQTFVFQTYFFQIKMFYTRESVNCYFNCKEHLTKITTAFIWKAIEGSRSAFYIDKKFKGHGPRWFQRRIRKRYTKKRYIYFIHNFIFWRI